MVLPVGSDPDIAEHPFLGQVPMFLFVCLHGALSQLIHDKLMMGQDPMEVGLLFSLVLTSEFSLLDLVPLVFWIHVYILMFVTIRFYYYL